MAVTSSRDIIRRLRGTVQRARTIREELETAQSIRSGGEPDPGPTGGTLQQARTFGGDPGRRSRE